jgi:hypothetical protein
MEHCQFGTMTEMVITDLPALVLDQKVCLPAESNPEAAHPE